MTKDNKISNKVKIFFTGSIRGGRTDQPQYAMIVDVLKKYGSLSSEHIADDELSEYGETHLQAEEVRERELKELGASELVVAEVTTPSAGVGYFIAQATRSGKKVIALYNREDTLRLSSIIKGDELVDVYTYDDEEDLENIFRDNLN